MTDAGVRALFEPKSVLLVGASEVKEKVGMASPALFRSVIYNMLRIYKGKTYVVDLSGKLRVAVKRFRDVPKKPDLGVLMLPPDLSLKHIRKFVNTGIKAIVAITGGYKPKQREEFIQATVKRGVRVLGPNTIMGVLNTANGLCTTFERGVMPKRGGIAVISQSGGVGATMLDWAWFYGIGISKFAFMGDKVDVDDADLINYLAKDKDTKVICIYMEGIEQGRRFVEAVRETVKHKPVCILKGGVTQEAARRALSHTASLAGQDEIFDAAFRQSGAIRVRDVEELFDAATALARQPPMLGNRVAIVSNVGGPAILAADAVYREGLTLAKLSNKIVKKITNKYPGVDVVNPIDTIADAKADRYEFILKQVLDDPNVDGVMVINMLKSCFLEPEDTKVVANVAKKFPKKPVVDVPIGGEDYMLIYDVLKDTKIPTYNLPDKAARALKALYLYGQIKQRAAA